ncbi:protein lin-9 homolog isoform X1 [Drosophila montana]|uniref:protein lin-9 homolog isoform X1 n=2 Tax=Drosophila montana TaxID=40370 RepID=UPI00313C00EF
MSDHFTDINQTATDSDSADTPPQLSKIGLRRAHRMSKTNESQRLLRSQTADKEDDELFVKLPKFSKRLRGKSSAEAQEPDAVDTSTKELLPANQRLYKYLKQPNCQRWIWCEFIESFIDKAILGSSYDMNNYVQSCFPQLETRQMPRRCWQLIRRNMGKARRFSPAFIAGERIELERSRRIVRQLQQRKFDMEQDGQSLELMPKQIPMPLPVDVKVISLLSAPQLMLCKGRVIGYEPRDSSYLIKFNIAGKHTVLSMPDCHLHVLQECKTFPLASIVQETEDKQLTTSEISVDTEEPKPLMDALLQLQKLLVLKRKTVQDMASMNEELEASGLPAPARRETKQTPLREKLQRRYASNMITLHRVNADILEPLRVAHHHLNEYETDALHSKCVPRNKLYEKCRTLAEMDLKASPCQGSVQQEPTRELILRLQTLLYLCGELGHGNNIEVDAVMDDFVSNLLVGLPPQLTTEFRQVVNLLQPLREHILAMSKTEAEPCQQLFQSDAAGLLLPNEESDIEMGL